MNNSDEILDKIKSHLLNKVKNGDSKFAYLPNHLNQVELWALKIILNHPEANKLVVLCSVWLHDIGLLTGSSEIDHAINSEIEVNRFLKELRVNSETILAISHCVLSHRNRDVKPQTIEAKILAVADSASHMTDGTYVMFINIGLYDKAKEKIERDYRDTGIFPEVKEEITSFYNAWKKIIELWPKDLVIKM